ncbi:MAG: sulfatase [Promethearchaeota archaeon]
MNVILILLDSLNKSFIGPYGNQHVKTKNMDRLAEKGIVFENHFLCSAPCLPARRELFSGRKNEFLWKFWGPVEPFDRLLPIEAKHLGAITALITDHYHYWEPIVHGYHENYMYTDLIRGHEYDSASSEPLEDPKNYPQWVKSYLKWRKPENSSIQYYRNVKNFKEEKDFHGPKVMQAACDWLDRNYSHEKFFLHIESFDPHEPFYIPEPYRSMYGPYNDNFTCWPPYQNKKQLQQFLNEVPDEQIEFVKNQYCGKVTMVDRWLGNVFNKLDQYHLWDNTMVILTTDHGHAIAEKDRKIQQYGKEHPIFEDVANIPLIIYHPEIEGNRRISTTFSTIVDIRATILEALGAESDKNLMVDGKSLIPILKREEKTIREYILYGTFGEGVNLTTWDTTYIRGFNAKKSINVYTSVFPLSLSPSVISSITARYGIKINYEMYENMLGEIYKNVESGFFIPDVNIPQWKIPLPSFYFSSKGSTKENKQNYMFDRKKDPTFQNNLAGKLKAEELENRMIKKIIEVLKLEQAPSEQFDRLMLNYEK